MTDIVERLREEPGQYSTLFVKAMFNEAADEIERLRKHGEGQAMIDIVERLRDHLSVIDAYPSQTRAAEMGGVVQSIRMAADEIERLRGEIEKLRAQVVSLQSSLDAGPPRPGKKTPNAANNPGS